MGVPMKAKNTKPISEARKIRKPLMEKKRRERINTCLNELASILTEAELVKVDPGKAIKLEKADVLEMTVKHWKNLNAKKLESNHANTSKYFVGYRECADIVSLFLMGIPEGRELRTKLNAHLQSEIAKFPSCKEHAKSIEESKVISKDIKTDSYLVPKKLSNGNIIFLLQQRKDLFPNNDKISSVCEVNTSCEENGDELDTDENGDELDTDEDGSLEIIVSAEAPSQDSMWRPW